MDTNQVQRCLESQSSVLVTHLEALLHWAEMLGGSWRLAGAKSAWLPLEDFQLALLRLEVVQLDCSRSAD